MDTVELESKKTKTANAFVLPKDGLAGLMENFKDDAISGFLVFLLAMPLSLGIAKASGFPPAMGLVTAIIGGMVVSFIAGSRLTIKGPAAGLIVIVAEAVAELGHGDNILGWKLALGTIVVAGLIQVLFGVFKIGSLSDFFPASAVHGMLAAIGLIIFAKQVPVLLGVDPAIVKGMGPIMLILAIPKSIMNMNPHVAIIGILSLVVLFGLPLIKNKVIRKIPSPLVVLVLTIPLGIYLHLEKGSLVVIGNFVENLGANVSFEGFSEPAVFAKFVVMFALVGSIESLLTVKAVDSLDSYKRKSNYNKDLIAVGFGNIVSGILGGLPMISEVARSSANVSNGAKTRWANFFHGLFLLLAVLAITPVIEMIPNAALAAMLIAVGYRLASPMEFIKTYKIGSEQLIIFVATVIVTLATDLLLGVGAGILAKLIISAYNYYIKPAGSIFKANVKVIEKGNKKYVIEIRDAANFMNLLSIKKHFSNLPPDANVTIDFSKAKMIDHTFMEVLHTFELDMHRTGGHVTVAGMENLIPNSQHPLAGRRALAKGEVVQELTSQLTKRQLLLKDFAAAQRLHFEINPSSALLRMHYMPFSLARKAKYSENVLIGSLDSYQFIFSDVLIQEANFITKPEFKMTLLLVHDHKHHLPSFKLEKEGLLYGLKDLTSKNKDINFAEYPAFSNAFYLSGENEHAIRSIFNSNVLTLLEKHRDYQMESSNGRIIIYKESELMSPAEMAEAVSFLDKFMRALPNEL